MLLSVLFALLLDRGNPGSKFLQKAITEAARSKAWTVFARWNSNIVGSKSKQGMDVYVRLLHV
jgi:hypothetical protein